MKMRTGPDRFPGLFLCRTTGTAITYICCINISERERVSVSDEAFKGLTCTSCRDILVKPPSLNGEGGGSLKTGNKEVKQKERTGEKEKRLNSERAKRIF